ncbi:MAG: sodium/proline symporter [Lentisphaeria bacterium]|nr:sodium/proline symporter [Lentisphaeria bacterium]
MKISEIVVFVVYLAFMLGIGVYFFIKDRNGGEKTFFLGDRKMGAWVGALSAGASDMSAWVLMGLPTAIYAIGLGEVWISAGLAIGYTISWLVQAPRLRRFSIVSGDAITIPQYLTNRFMAKSKALQVICALVFLLAYTIYTAASIKACGILFHKVIGLDVTLSMYLAAFIVVGYTFLGGFSAVCWTDFFQGLLILATMLTAPLFAIFMLDSTTQVIDTPHYWNAFGDWRKVVSGLTWGLGYFGMPHIIIRFMSLSSQKELKKSAKIGISWTVLIVIFAAAIGLIGRMKLGMQADIKENELVFIQMVRMIFPGVISGVLLSAVLAASMSTADSQLLSASSALASDVYKPIIRKDRASEFELLWVGRIIVLAVAMVSMLIAANPNAGSIMGLVTNAWGLFGAAFGPAIMLSLFWRRFNFAGAAAGIIIGAAADIAWLYLCPKTGIYELLPGFVIGAIGAVVVTLLTRAPSAEVMQLYDRAVTYDDKTVDCNE